jgi:hypothetical protein
MIGRFAAVLALGCLLPAPGQAQKGEGSAADVDYVRVEIRGTLKVEAGAKRDAVRVTLAAAAVPANFPPESRTWRLAFPGRPELRRAAEKLAGKTVVVRGDLSWGPGYVDKSGDIVADNRPFHPAPWGWVVFVRDLKPADAPQGK